MGVLDICKTEEDPFKNAGARVFIKRSPIVCLCRFFMMFKGCLINSLRLVLLKVQTYLSFLWLPLLPERIKKIQSKVRALERSQHYPSVLKMLKGS